MNLDEIRARLSGAQGPTYWRSFEEVAATPEFQAFVNDEFPNRTPDWNDAPQRREFLKLMAASLALAGAGACTKQPRETIVPYVNQPEDIVPGKPLFYATAFPLDGAAEGILVESHMGRPTKIEGNPNHPASMGACDKFALASILNLYDPDRSQVVLKTGNISSWINFVSVASQAVETLKQKKGAGLYILSGVETSPTFAAQMKMLLADFPLAKWHQFSPTGQADTSQVFGQPVNVIYRFDRAARIVSLDSDFLGCGSGHLRYAHDYAVRRRLNSDVEPSRLYVAEGTPSSTGGIADHHFRMRTADVETFAHALASALGVSAPAAQGTPVPMDRVSAIARDLQAHRGSSVVVPGDYQPASVHALAHLLNQRLGAVGQTVIYTDAIEANPSNAMQSLKQLVDEMRSGQVEVLFILGVNPLYEAPADLDFAGALQKVKLRVCLGEHYGETSELCHWHIPETHYLEGWSDVRAFDGTATIQQPLLAPIYGAKSRHELISVLSGFPDRTSHDIVKDYWRTVHQAKDFEDFWQISLHDGVVAGTAFPPKSVPEPKPASQQRAVSGLEVVFRPDPAIGCGAFSNNGWLQEMPKPQNKMTWDNAVWVSPATAQKLQVKAGDVVELQHQGRRVSGPVWVLPGHANDSVTVHLGYGRRLAGRVSTGLGFNANLIRTTAQPWCDSGVELRVTGAHHEFASTQHTQTMEGREPFQLATLEEYRQKPNFAHHEAHSTNELSLFPEHKYDDYKWGMAIDLNACIGCHACTVACQSENNIPVVGKREVTKGRHMNWLRVDRYYHGSLDDPDMYFQPVPCMQCENAPCELVCPVAATVHSGDGLNQMIYNRCVGTRYCSNNCPYKVRRFNFYLYSDWYTESLRGVRNPDVTVRSRGVMEKCTYCVQRINRVKIESEKENRRIRDGEVMTACQQACPTSAIVFGDLNDRNSQVVKLKAEPRNYGLLEELNTRPRTTYLARLRNPNPDLEKG